MTPKRIAMERKTTGGNAPVSTKVRSCVPVIIETPLL